MKSHVIRPFFILIGFVVIVNIARAIFVPNDFKAANGDYKYQWHRVSNEEEWKNFKVKYQSRKYCEDCHTDQFEFIKASKHAMVQCENCHEPAIEHPENPEKLTIDRSRDLCLRCHAKLPYRPSTYAQLPTGPIELKMQDPDEHNPEYECVECHDVHKADFK